MTPVLVQPLPTLNVTCPFTQLGGTGLAAVQPQAPAPATGFVRRTVGFPAPQVAAAGPIAAAKGFHFASSALQPAASHPGGGVMGPPLEPPELLVEAPELLVAPPELVELAMPLSGPPASRSAIPTTSIPHAAVANPMMNVPPNRGNDTDRLSYPHSRAGKAGFSSRRFRSAIRSSISP